MRQHATHCDRRRESHRTDSNRRPAVYKTAGEDAQLLQSKALSEHDSSDYTKNDTKDPTLALVVEAWCDLPDHIKAAINTLITSTFRDKSL